LRIAVTVCAVGCAAWAIVRLAGLDHGFPLVALIAFTPYALIGSAAVLLVASIVRAWPAAAIAGAALAALVTVVLPRVQGTERLGDRERGQVTVLALNLYRGEADLQAVTDLIRRRHADIVCLSELTRAAEAELRRAGLRPPRFKSVSQAAPGADGTAVYVRAEIERAGGISPGLGTTPMARGRFRLAGVGWDATSVHPRAPTGVDSTSRWAAGIEALPEPQERGIQVLAGDFNATLDHSAFRDLLGSGYEDAADEVGAGLGATWPVLGSPAPPITLDHVLVEDSAEVVSFETEEVPLTDHRAVIAELHVPDG
jgi:endonuclease/exonuclease/phosphatase (EEP) superfamily protein YafD